MREVCAVIVTYNRKKLIEECLRSVLNQSYKPDAIIVFDNASTDGTKEYLHSKGLLSDERIDYIRIESNIGPAGAFAEGYRYALGKDCKWIWAMDDDTIPTTNCLEELICATKIPKKDKASFYASVVFGENGEFMNVPGIDESQGENGYPGWYGFLNEGLVKIKYGTFVSILFCSDAVNMCGFPIREFRMWGSDSEYTRRLSKHFGPGYFVGKSKAIHKRKNVKNLSVYDENDNERRKQYRYLYQGAIIIRTLYESNGKAKSLLSNSLKEICKGIVNLNRKYGGYGLRESLLGSILALKKYGFFKKEIDKQIKNGVKRA